MTMIWHHVVSQRSPCCLSARDRGREQHSEQQERMTTFASLALRGALLIAACHLIVGSMGSVSTPCPPTPLPCVQATPVPPTPTPPTPCPPIVMSTPVPPTPA